MNKPMPLIVVLITIASLAFTMSESLAQGIGRDGFLLEMGFGLGNARIGEYGQGEQPRESVSRSGLATHGKVGWAVGESLQIYYQNTNIWFKQDDGVAAQGFTGLGCTYFLASSTPSYFVTMGLGMGWISSVESGLTGAKGFGGSVGVGKELSNFLNVQVEVSYSSPKVAVDLADDTNADATTVSFFGSMKLW